MSKSKLGINEMIKLGLILVCYAVASCAILAVVNTFTSKKIAENEKGNAAKAMTVVYADADEFEQVTDFTPSSNGSIVITNVYLAKKGGSILGGVAQVEGPTYDKGKIIVGMDKNGNITGMKILELTDSPGFGLKANDPNFKLASGLTFYDQFTGKTAKDGFKAGTNFDAITGATITSNGIGAMITEGTNCLLKYLEAK